MINENYLATVVTTRDSGKEKSSLGQNKQIIRITLDYLADQPIIDVIDMLKHHGMKFNGKIIYKTNFWNRLKFLFNRL